MSAAGRAEREDGEKKHGGARRRGRRDVVMAVGEMGEDEHNATMIVVTHHLSLGSGPLRPG